MPSLKQAQTSFSFSPDLLQQAFLIFSNSRGDLPTLSAQLCPTSCTLGTKWATPLLFISSTKSPPAF